MPGFPSDNLTGNIRYRTGWRGRLVLQVEQELTRIDKLKDPSGPTTEWRDAIERDLLVLSYKERIQRIREQGPAPMNPPPPPEDWYGSKGFPPSGGSARKIAQTLPLHSFGLEQTTDYPVSWDSKVRDLKKNVWEKHNRNPSLEELMAAAATHIMSPEEVEEQRKSWARGMSPCEHGWGDFEDCPECREKALKKVKG